MRLAWGATPGQSTEFGQTWSFRGTKSRNKVSVGEPAEGSLEKTKNSSGECWRSHGGVRILREGQRLVARRLRVLRREPLLQVLCT